MKGKLGIVYERHNHALRYDYTLIQDWVVWVPTKGVSNDLQIPGPFENKWFKVERQDRLRGGIWTEGLLFTVRAGYAWDGATAVPDRGAVEGSCIHDSFYQFAMAIAALWDWSVARVLDLADWCFRAVMQMANSSVAGLYYAGVRLIGTAFWYVAHWREWLAGKKITDGQATTVPPAA